MTNEKKLRNRQFEFEWICGYIKTGMQRLNLIRDKLWIWDRRFFECNCSGIKDKETGKFSDPMLAIMSKRPEGTVF